VKGNVGVCRQPVVVILVGGEVVEDDMDLPIGRLLGDQVGHKGLEIDAFLGLRGLSPNDAGGHFERSEQVDRAVPFVGALQAVNNLATAGQDISAGAFQRLDRRLLVDAQDQRVCRWVQVKADNIGGLIRLAGCGKKPGIWQDMGYNECCQRDVGASMRGGDRKYGGFVQLCELRGAGRFGRPALPSHLRANALGEVTAGCSSRRADVYSPCRSAFAISVLKLGEGIPRHPDQLGQFAAASNGFGMPEGVLIADRGAATGCPPCFGAR
jgi:hypothetical protein